MTTYITTVGTSASQAIVKHIAPPAPSSDDKSSRPRRLDAALVHEQGGIKKTVELLKPHFCAFDFLSDADLRGKLSAEIHSLVRAQITPRDNVLLLSTDTDDGEVCALLVKHYLHERMGMPSDRVELKRIKGLQVDDQSTFRKTGVVEYIKAITNEIQRCGPENVVLNPTGGYKVLIPYSTIMAMINGLRAIYIFDNGRALLSLPRLPLEFENSRLESLLPAMDRIQKETAILESDFWGSMPHHDRQELRDVLLENAGDGMVTLSAVGLLVHEGLIASLSRSLVRVFLSRQAIDDLVDAPKHWNALDFLQQIERHLVNQIKLHKLSDGTDWLKPGNTDDRYRVELNGRDMLVYRILPHDEYEKCVGKPWPYRDYAPFVALKDIKM